MKDDIQRFLKRPADMLPSNAPGWSHDPWLALLEDDVRAHMNHTFSISPELLLTLIKEIRYLRTDGRDQTRYAEVRYADTIDGTRELDEVVARPVGFHMESMGTDDDGTDAWWIGLNFAPDTGEMLHINLVSDSEIRVTLMNEKFIPDGPDDYEQSYPKPKGDQ